MTRVRVPRRYRQFGSYSKGDMAHLKRMWAREDAEYARSHPRKKR